MIKEFLKTIKNLNLDKNVVYKFCKRQKLNFKVIEVFLNILKKELSERHRDAKIGLFEVDVLLKKLSLILKEVYFLFYI